MPGPPVYLTPKRFLTPCNTVPSTCQPVYAGTLHPSLCGYYLPAPKSRKLLRSANKRAVEVGKEAEKDRKHALREG